MSYCVEVRGRQLDVRSLDALTECWTLIFVPLSRAGPENANGTGHRGDGGRRYVSCFYRMEVIAEASMVTTRLVLAVAGEYDAGGKTEAGSGGSQQRSGGRRGRGASKKKDVRHAPIEVMLKGCEHGDRDER